MSRQYLGLSGLAMVLVVLRHALELGTTWQGHTTLTTGPELFLYSILHSLGPIAVPLFLFVSGGFTAYAARGNPPRLTWQWLQSTLLRLFWPYLLWSSVFYLFIFLQRDEGYSLFGYVKNLLVGYPFHFIPLLVFFYILSPLLAYCARRYALITLGVIALYQIFLGLARQPEVWGVALPSWTELFVPPIISGTFATWGIYFPLGLVLGLQGKHAKTVLQRYRWALVGTTALFYLLAMWRVHPGFGSLYPLTGVLLAPIVRRDQIPWVTWFEEVGKRSYGVYLTHLLVISLGLIVVETFMPGLFAHPWLLSAGLFAAGLFLPLFVMQLTWRLPARATWRYVFG